MNHQPSHGSRRARGREAVHGSDEELLTHHPGGERRRERNDLWRAETAPRSALGQEQATQSRAGLDDDAWVPERRQFTSAAWGDERGTGRLEQREGFATPVDWDDRAVAVNGTYPAGGGRGSRGYGQTITFSVPALRTFLTLAAVVVLSVVLSVIATITIIAVMNAGVILPQYARLNQPTQVGQLGICVSKTGKVTTPTNVGFCRGGTFVHVQPKLAQP